VTNLSSSFPFSAQRADIDLDGLLNVYLPSWEEAWRLSSLYLEQAPWFFGAVTKRQLLEEMLPSWYEEAPRPSQPSGQQLTKGAHELALLFVILCFGALTDMNLPAAPDNPLAEEYYNLTKVTFVIDSV
jgi:hypothetical protein